MQIGPLSFSVVSATVSGYAVLDSVEQLQVGVNFWLNATGELPLYCEITEINRATKTIGVRAYGTLSYGRTDISAYGPGTINVPEQLWVNPLGPTFQAADIQGSLTVDGDATIYGLTYIGQYSTLNLPDATTTEGAIAYDTTAQDLVFSDGTSWVSTGGGGSGVTTLAAIGSSPNANGATISGVTLNLQPADSTYGGVLTAGTQSIAGNKTFTGTISASNLSGSNTGDQTITLTGNVTGSGTGSFATTIANNVVTLGMLAQVATARFLGRTSASTGDVESLTATQATALLNAMVGDTGSGGTKGLVPAPTTGDATKFLKGDGTWGTPTDTGVTTVGTFGSSPTANAASISGSTLTIQPADATNPGAVSTTTQTFAGSKTLAGATITTDATGTVAALTANATFSSNTNPGARVFSVVKVKPTLAFGASNGGTTVDVLQIDTTNTTTTGNTTNLINAYYGGTSKFKVGSDGKVTCNTQVDVGSGNFYSTGTDAFVGGFIRPASTGAAMKIRGADSASADIAYFGSSVALTTGVICRFYNDLFVTEKARIESDGSYITTAGAITGGTFTANNSLIQSGNSQAMEVKGWAADGAGAIGVKIIGAQSLTTAGAVIANFYNSATAKASVNKDGQFRTIGTGKYLEISASQAVTAANEIIVVKGNSGAVTVTLPLASTVAAGYGFTVKDGAGTAVTYNITIARAGSDLIDGATSQVLTMNWGSATLVSDGASAWYLI